MEPVVTIAIPTTGRLELLERSIASALAQTYASVEILVGDNSASPAVHSEILSRVQGNSRLRVIRQATRLSMSAHWNALATEAKGNFFVLLADDDLLEAGFVEKLLELRREAPEAAVFFSDHWVIDENNLIDGESTERYSRDNGRSTLPRGLLKDSAIAVWKTSVPICASMIKTELIRKHRFNEGLNTPELEFFVRLVADSIRFAYLPERLARYRVHGGSETQAVGLRYDALFTALSKIFVPPSAEKSRQDLLSNLLVTATTAAFLKGDFGKVREFLRSPHYLKSMTKRPVVLLQRVCGVLPRPFALPVYAFLYRSLRSIQGRRQIFIMKRPTP